MMYEELTEKIIAIVYEVHRRLGHGFLEKVYQNAFAHELRLHDIDVEQEYAMDVKYRDCIVGYYSADLFVEEKVIVELKCVERCLQIHHVRQVKNYLSATGCKCGLLFIFGRPYLDFNRVFPPRVRPTDS